MTGDLRQFVEGLLLVIAALLPIVNPFGGAPVFLAMTTDCTAALRAALAQKIAINAFILLLASLFVGTYVLEFFGLSVPIVQVAGGIVVCANAWELLRAALAQKIAINAFILLLASLFVGTYVLEFFGLSVPIVQVAGGIVVCANAWELLRAGSVTPVMPADAPVAAEIASRAFYPLTLPLTVGPGTISVAITIGAHHPQSVRSLVVHGAAHVIGAALIAATVFVCYRYADRMLRVLGETGTSVLIRLSAFILLCIGVQIFWTGATALLAALPIAALH